MSWTNAKRAVLLLLVAATLLGCIDHRQALARRTLMPKGKFDGVAFAGALNAKFPAGTPLEGIRRFAEENDGRCHVRSDDGDLWCEITLRGTFCAAELAGIRVKSKNGLIEVITVTIGGLSC